MAKMSKMGMAKKVMSHLRQDRKEYKDMMWDDKTLMSKLKGLREKKGRKEKEDRDDMPKRRRMK